MIKTEWPYPNCFVCHNSPCTCKNQSVTRPKND